MDLIYHGLTKYNYFICTPKLYKLNLIKLYVIRRWYNVQFHFISIIWLSVFKLSYFHIALVLFLVAYMFRFLYISR